MVKYGINAAKLAITPINVHQTDADQQEQLPNCQGSCEWSFYY